MTGDAISYFDERPLFLFLVALRRLYIGRLARRQAPAARWAGPRVFSGVARFARSKNLRRRVLLPPYTPASLSAVYSRIFRRASGGSCGDNNMRLMIAAESPEPLWLALRMVQVVLRASPSAFDCSSSVRNPASTRACPTSLIFAACRAFISATTGFLFFSCNELSPDRPVVKPAPNSSVVLLKSASIAWLADV
jgi:hypothetical protein